MTNLISATGRPEKPILFFLCQFAITLLALPAYYLAVSLPKIDAFAFVAALVACFIAFGLLRRLIQPQSLSLRNEGDGKVFFSGRFEGGEVAFSRPIQLANSSVEQERLALKAVDGELVQYLTTKNFDPATLKAIDASIARVTAGDAADPTDFPQSLKVAKHEHKGNVVLYVGERPSAALLQFLAFAAGLICFVAVVKGFA